MAEETGLGLIDFETGNTSAFSSLNQDGGNTLTASTDAEAHGTYGGKCSFSGLTGDNLCNGVKIFATANSVYVRLYYYVPTDFSADAAGSLIFMRLYNGSTVMGYLRIPSFANGLFDRMYYRMDSGELYYTISGVTLTKGAWHCIEHYYKSSSSADANDGIVRAWLDETLIAEVTGIDNDTILYDRIAVGQIGTTVPHSTAYLYIDDIKIDSSYIGPYSDSSAKTYTGSGTITLSGSAVTKETNTYFYIGNGNITLSGAAITNKTEISDDHSYNGSGTINISGASHTKGYTLVIDHTYVNKYNTIPQSIIDKIKKYRMCIAGESHSLGFRTGLQLVENLDAKFAVNIVESGTPELGSVVSYIRSDRLTWGDYTHATGWVDGHGEEDNFTNAAGIAQVKTGLKYLQDNNFGLTIFGFGWCWDQSDGAATASISSIYKCAWYGSTVGGPEGDKAFGLTSADYAQTTNSINMDSYLNATREYIAYAKINATSITVIFTTGPLDTHEDERGYQRHLKKEMIRNEVLTNGGILLDDGDILAYDDAGNENLLTWTDTESGEHEYQHIAADNLLDLDGVDRSSTTGYHIGERGATRLGKAQWVLAAYIVGWDGTPEGTYVGSGNIQISGSALASETNNYSYSGNGSISLSGLGITKETNNYSNIGSGEIEIVGASPTSYTDEVAYSYIGNGTINLSGEADTKEINYYIYSGNGEIIISGSAITEENLNNYTYIGSGTFIISGSAITSSNTGEIVAGHWKITLSSRSPSISLSSRAPLVILGGK